MVTQNWQKLLTSPLNAGIIAGVVYHFTLAPTLTWANHGADGGELITAAFTLGIPHPPGYPTYVLLGKLFSFRSFGAVAYRLNLFSAVCMATAVVFVAAGVRYQLSAFSFQPAEKAYIPTVTALCLAFAPLVWGQAVITEVYGLNLAVVAALWWALWTKRPSWLVGLLAGLSLTTHLTSWLLLPMVLIWHLSDKHNWFRLLGGLGLGLTPLLCLPVLARGNSVVVWGDPTTLTGWWWLVSGRLYQPNLLAWQTADFVPWFWQWAGTLGQQFTWVGWLLIGAGVWLVGQKRGGELPVSGKLTVLGLVGTAVFYFLAALIYHTPNALVYTLPGLLLLTPFLAVSLHHLGPVAWLLPLAALLFNFQAQNLRGDDQVRPLAFTIFVNAPPDALLETSGDRSTFPLWYVQQVEKQRADAIIVDANLLAFEWYRARLQKLYPDLLGLESDNLMAFRTLNGQKRPYCLVTLVPTETTPDTLLCLSFHE